METTVAPPVVWRRPKAACTPAPRDRLAVSQPLAARNAISSAGRGGYGAPQAAPIYGAGQHTYRTAKPAPTIASVPAEMTPAIAGEEAPPAPEVRETSGLLLPTPSGN